MVRKIAALLVSLIILFGFVIIVIEITPNVEAPGPTLFNGLISSNTTWTLTNSPYILTGNVLVDKNITLAIEPGVEVKFDGYYYLMIDGALNATGNDINMIIFTSNQSSPIKGDWQYIKFRDPSDDKNCNLIYCVIEYSEYGIYLESGTSPSIENTTISNNNEHGIYLKADSDPGASPKIFNNNISNNGGSGIAGSRGSPSIYGNIILNNSGHGINFWSIGDKYIINNIIMNNNGDGICGNAISGEILNNTIRYNKGNGVFLKEGPAQVSGNVISFNGESDIDKAGIRIYLKYPLNISNNIIINNANGIIFYDNPQSLTDYIVYNNDIYGNLYYGIKNNISTDTNARNNYWGTTNKPEIDSIIYDFYDDFNWGKVLYDPFLIEPILSMRNATILKTGWNLISIPLIQENQNLIKVLENIEGEYDGIQWYNSTDIYDQWKHHKVGKPFGNDLFDLNETMGFWIHITQPGDTIFLYNGTQPSSNQSITLHPGWNMVGYPSLSNRTRDNALNNINFGSDVDAIWTFNAATQTWQNIGPTDYFELGRGYWIHSKVTKIWDVPL